MYRKIASVTLAFSTTLWLSGAVFVAPVAAQVGSVQDQINALLQQIAALQAQLSGLQAGGAAGALSKNLKLGMSDPEVSTLQSGLKLDSAVYPEGLVTGFFGPLTHRAVIRFQEKYASEVLSSWGLSSGSGFVGSTTRAKFNALYGGVAVPGAPAAPVAGGLAVSLDPMAGGTVVADETSGDGAQGLAEVLRLRFSGSARVTQLRVHRIGISADSDFSNAYLYDGDRKVAEAPAVASGYFSFTNSAGLFDVSGTKVISFRIDIANGVSSGKTFQFGVIAASDVVSNAVSVSGGFPFHGPEWRTATVGDLGKLTATSSSPTADATVDAGSLDYEVWKVRLDSADQKIAVSYLKYTLVGTAEYDAVQNLKLYVDGVQVGSAVPLMNTDKTLAYALASPIELAAGVQKNLALRGDIIKGSGRNLYFQLQNASDIVAKDVNYGVMIKVNQKDVWTIVKPPTDIEITVNSGSLTIQKSTASPTGPLADGSTNLELARWDFKAVGEDIKISSIDITWDEPETLNQLRLVLDGVQIGTTVSAAQGATTTQTFNPGGSFVVPAGVTKKLSAWADLTHSSIADTDTIQIDLEAGSGNALRLSSGSTFNAPSAQVSANTVTVSASTLTVSKNSAVSDVTTVKGASGIIVGSWLVTAPSAEGVNVTSIKINDGTSTPGLGSAFDALAVWSGGVQYGSTINSPSSATDTAQTFSFGTALNIPAGQSKQIDLKANIITNADTTWSGDAGDHVRIATLNSTGVVTNSAVNKDTDTTGQTVRILAAATLTLDEEVSPTMPSSQYLVSGDTSQTLAAWKFSVDNSEDVKVNRIKVFEIGTDNLFGNVINLKLFVDGVQVGAAVPAFAAGASATSDSVLFEDVSAGLFSIPKNTSKSVVLKVDMTSNTNAVFQTDGADLRVTVEQATTSAVTATSNVSAKGATSGAFVTLASNCASSLSCDSNNMKVVKTKPTFALVSPASTTLIPGEVEILRFRITAHSAEDLKLTSGTHNVRLTQTSSGPVSGSTAHTFKLFDAADNTRVDTIDRDTAGIASAGTTNFVGANTTIAKGTTKEFYVKANLSNFTGAGNSYKVDINNAAADFSWSDISTGTPDISNADFVGQGLPLFGPTFVKP